VGGVNSVLAPQEYDVVPLPLPCPPMPLPPITEETDECDDNHQGPVKFDLLEIHESLARSNNY
jgi:hypothetical protein